MVIYFLYYSYMLYFPFLDQKYRDILKNRQVFIAVFKSIAFFVF